MGCHHATILHDIDELLQGTFADLKFMVPSLIDAPAQNAWPFSISQYGMSTCQLRLCTAGSFALCRSLLSLYTQIPRNPALSNQEWHLCSSESGPQPCSCSFLVDLAGQNPCILSEPKGAQLLIPWSLSTCYCLGAWTFQPQMNHPVYLECRTR